jgi:hypothetical protein
LRRSSYAGTQAKLRHTSQIRVRGMRIFHAKRRRRPMTDCFETIRGGGLSLRRGLSWTNGVPSAHRPTRITVSTVSGSRDEPPYFKLVWQLEYIERCVEHQIALVTSCTRCGTYMCQSSCLRSPLLCHACRRNPYDNYHAWVTEAALIKHFFSDEKYNRQVVAQDLAEVKSVRERLLNRGYSAYRWS